MGQLQGQELNLEVLGVDFGILGAQVGLVLFGRLFRLIQQCLRGRLSRVLTTGSRWN